MTAQRLSIHVPFSNTLLQMGDSVGGPGVSLSTANDVLLDCVGVMDVQSKGQFVAQTNAVLMMLSAATQKIHSQGKVEVYAGGGKNPGPCGTGSPAGAPETGAPGAVTEKVTGLACAALSGVSASYGVSDAKEAGTGMAIALGVAGIAAAGGVGAVAKVFMSPKTKPPPGETHGVVANAIRIAFGGGADIEERASANIKMVAGKKISGIAPLMITAKTLGKYEVKALLVTDFTTTLFSNFALAKFEVKALDVFKTTSIMFDVQGDVATNINTLKFTGKSEAITMNGVTHVTGTMDVTDKTTCDADLLVERNAMLKGKIKVHGYTRIKGKLTVKRDVMVKSNITVDGDTKTEKLELKSSVTFGL